MRAVRRESADVVVVGAGLAGLVATRELTRAGRTVLLVDQEPATNLGGQAHWSFGGLFGVDTPEQRRLGIRDDLDLAWQDWLGTAGFDRARDDRWPRAWARAYVEFAAGEQRSWLRALGVRFFPVVGWAERGGGLADGPGNSVPRFHIAWGTGPGLLEPFVRAAVQAQADGLLRVRWRYRVDELLRTDGAGSGGAISGVRGRVLAPDPAARGVASNRRERADFELAAGAVVLATGGIGGDPERVRRYWPARLGPPPAQMLTGVPAYVDGRMLDIGDRAGAHLINRDRMWHYTEGVTNHDPVWPNHGIRILPGPSSLWLDAAGHRLPPPLFPGFDTLGTLTHLLRTGHPHSWFVLTRAIAEREFALSGSEQNPDLTGRDWRGVLRRALPGATGPVDVFIRRGADFVTAQSLPELVQAMNRLTPTPLLAYPQVESEVLARDREIANPYSKDQQMTALRGARRYVGDRLIRVARPHRLLDRQYGPLIAVKLHVLTRKSLGGFETDLAGRVLRADGTVLPGLYAAGEAAGFGGGGMHGYRSLEGTFLGGCLLSGRVAGATAAG